MAKSVLINILGNPASALAALEEVGIKAQETAKKTAGIGESSDKSSSKFGAFGKYAVGALVVAGVATVDWGNKLEDAHVQLVTAIKDAGGSMSQLAPQVAAVDKRMESLGFTNAQTEQSLAQMTIGLHSGQKAMDLIGLAADIARARHIDLATASLLVVKASEGQTMALRRAGIDLPVMASGALKVKTAEEQLAKAQDTLNALLKAHPDAVDAASKSHAKYEAALLKVQAAQSKLANLQTAGGQIIDALSQRYGGQASAAADTFSGRMDVMRARIQDVGAEIGIALIPVLEHLMTVTASVIGWLDKHRAVAVALAAVIGGVLVASLFAEGGALAFLLGPIGLVVLAVAGMIAIGIALYENWDRVLRFLRSGFGTLVQVIILGPFAIISLLALHWRQAWDGMRSAVSGFVGFFQGVAGWFAGVAGSIAGFFSGIPGAIWNNFILPVWNMLVTFPDSIVRLFENVGKGIADAVIAGLNGLIWGWNQLASALTFKVPSWVPFVGGDSFGLPQASPINYLAAGGLVTGEGLAYIHAGEQVIPAAQTTGLRGAGPAAGSGGGDLVMMIDGREFGRVAGPSVRTWLLQEPRRNATRVIG